MGPSLPPLTIGQKYKKVMQNKLKWKKFLHFFFDLEPKIEKCLLFSENKDLKVAYKFWSQKLFFYVILMITLLVDSKHNSGNTVNIC